MHAILSEERVNVCYFELVGIMSRETLTSMLSASPGAFIWVHICGPQARYLQLIERTISANQIKLNNRI